MQHPPSEARLFHRKLWTLLLPITFQNFMVALVGVSDALMLGFISQEALAAVSLANQIPFILHLCIVGFVMGLSIFEAQYWGRKDHETFEQYFAFAIKLAAAVSLIFALASLIVPGALMRIYTPDPDLIREGSVYLRIVGPSMLFVSISQLYICTLKNSERATKATMITSTAVVLNIVLNAILIFGLLGVPAMGVAGAAIATLVSRTVEMIWCMRVIARSPSVKLRRRYLRKAPKGLPKQFWRYTLPVLANSVSWGIAFSMYSVIMGRLGSDAVAANAIANIVKNLISSLIFGLGGGASIIIGNELGAGRLDRAREYGTRLLRVALFFGVLSGALNLAVSPLVVQVASLTPQAAYYLRWMLVMSSYNIIGMAFNIVTFNGIFVAGGDGKFGFYCDTVTMWGVIVPLGFLSAFVWKLPVLAVYFILYLDELIKIPVVYWNYRRRRWIKDLTVHTPGVRHNELTGS